MEKLDAKHDMINVGRYGIYISFFINGKQQVRVDFEDLTNIYGEHFLHGIIQMREDGCYNNPRIYKCVKIQIIDFVKEEYDYTKKSKNMSVTFKQYLTAVLFMKEE